MPPFFPAKVIEDMMIPAATTPVKIEDNATAVGIPFQAMEFLQTQQVTPIAFQCSLHQD
jgi:hypothetical protein